MNPAEKYYDKLSSIYDKATAEVESWTPPSLIAEVIKKVDDYKSILIIGVGTGKDIEAISPSEEVLIEGIDVSSSMLKFCKTKFPAVILHHGDFSSFDLSSLRLSHYDVVICSGTLEFIADFQGFFRKVSGLLKNGSYLLVTYEPQILFHPVQRDRNSEVVSERAGNFDAAGLITYRRTNKEFIQQVDKEEFSIIDFFEFVAYHKLNSGVIYHLALLKKN